MKTLSLVFGLLVTTVFMNAQQSIEGIWNTGRENTKIEIKNSIGKIYSSDNDKGTTGKLMIKDLVKSNNEYRGKLYIIRKDRWVDAVFVPNENSLQVTVSAGLQQRTMVWNLVKQ